MYDYFLQHRVRFSASSQFLSRCFTPKDRMSLHASRPGEGREWGAVTWCEVQGDIVDLRF